MYSVDPVVLKGGFAYFFQQGGIQLGLFCIEKVDSGTHVPTQATLGKLTFHTFPFLREKQTGCGIFVNKGRKCMIRTNHPLPPRPLLEEHGQRSQFFLS